MHVIQALEQLKSLLPGDTPNKSDGEWCLETFGHFVCNDEPELALAAADYIAEAHHRNNTPLNREFWTRSKQLAHYSAQRERTTYSDTVTETEQTIDRFLNIDGDSMS